MKIVFKDDYMKKVISIMLVLAMCLSLTGCIKTYSNVEDYSIIYENVKNANKTFTKDAQVETLLRWGEYMYCSYLLLFPRESPDGISEFQYYWGQSMDYDDYSIYFSYKLDNEEYQSFKSRISEFTISYKDQNNKPIFAADLFEHPAYIMSWSNDVEGTGFCEYIMLDDKTHTIINVYKMFRSLQEIQETTQHNILPKNMNYAAISTLLPDNIIHFAKHDGYSVYAFENENGEMFVPSIEDIKYDNSFLENL